MTQFNKGDRVVRTGYNFPDVLQGSTYIVDHQVRNTLYLEGFIAGYTADRFELANVTKPVPPWPFRGTHKGTFSGSQINLQNLPKAEGAYNPNVGHATDGGGLQQHSIGGPFPFVLVGIDNPTGLKPGTYWYVQDKTGIRCTIHFRKCEDAATHAAKLATNHPDGVANWPIPPLSASEGYIKPNVTITMTREEAEAVSVAIANLCIPGTNIVTNVLALLRAQGVEWKEVTKTFARGFDSYGDTLNCEIEPGRLKPSGGLTLARRVKL